MPNIVLVTEFTWKDRTLSLPTRADNLVWGADAISMVHAMVW